MSATAAAPEPWRFAGLPLTAWTFALRNWVAMMLALYVAFWLQLESASSAAVCVGILSLQTRGQAFHKAIYRMAGTVLGVVVSIVIAGVFSQTRDLFFLTCCLWLGLCAMTATLLDGNRAYGAVLSGYTVAIVAVPNVDTPLSTFNDGINRGAAIAIGILAMAVVSDFFSAPEFYPTVLGKIEALRDKVRAYAVKALRTGGAAPADTAALVKEITALHPDIIALPSESLRGQARADAAGAAVTGLLRSVAAARVVSGSLAAMGPAGEEPRENLVHALEGRPYDNVRERAMAVMARDDASAYHLVAASSCLVLFEQTRETERALAAMREGRPPARVSRLFLYKPWPAAIRGGARAAFALGFTAWILSLLNWPSTTTILVQVGALVGISATNPNPKGFAVGALFAMPLVAVAGGVTQFLILDGVDQFQLLTLGMGPTIILGSLLVASGNMKLFGVGFLTLVYFPIMLSLANPQTYNPQTFLFTAFLSLTAVIAVYLALAIVLPNSPAMQRRWALASARADLRQAVFSRTRIFDPLACGFRDSDRVGQFSGQMAEGGTEADLRFLIRMSDLASCARRIRTAIRTHATFAPLRQSVSTALATLDEAALRRLGRAVVLESRDRPTTTRRLLRQVGTDLLFAAVLIERSPRVVAELQGERGR